MNTPICDFVRDYAAGNPVRFHMPGHKGSPEPNAPIAGNSRKENSFRFPDAAFDITEIPGADVLYHANGIILESEKNAAGLFGSARTLYSAEGSSLCIRAMLYLCAMNARRDGKSVRIAAGRNAHRVFSEAAAVLDLDVIWVGEDKELLRCDVRAEELEPLFQNPSDSPTAVYVTSPDYLGHCTDLRPLAELCHRYGALLLVDNAHGAYLKFLSESRHPMDCGADLCCDSAHKTLPVLTGGAYLHASRGCPEAITGMMERGMELFSSTSPSWLILQSLDAVNALLASDYPGRIRKTAERAGTLKRKLSEAGWGLAGDETLKITLCPKKRGYTGTELEQILRGQGIVCEFADPDYLVLMVTPQNTENELLYLENALNGIPGRDPIAGRPPRPGHPRRILSPHEALFLPSERIAAEQSAGRILASPCVSCPPAVPICACGEEIDEQTVALFRYYGIDFCDVVAVEEQTRR